MLSLGAGNPNPDAFPFESAVFKLKDGSSIPIDADLMRDGLQYGPSSGLAPLLSWIRRTIISEHNPSRKESEWEIAVTTGSQDAISKACDMLVARGDSVLIEEPAYPGTLGVLRPLGAHLVAVETDHGGLRAEVLASTLDSWHERNPKSPKPRVLYTVPTGHNPSGATLSQERKQAIYAIAQKHNLLILEDDPYYFLQLDGPQGPGGFRRPPQSFFSMDTDGRVLRFDSMSKVLSSGLRLGFATGPPALIERLVLHLQTAALCTSGLSQMAAVALFREWGDDGWASHICSVQELYRRRRDHFLKCAQQHLGGLAEWTVPEAGMFVWMRLLGVTDSKTFIEGPARDHKVLLVPGSCFTAHAEIPSPFVRASYSLASENDMDEALRRLASLLEESKR